MGCRTGCIAGGDTDIEGHSPEELRARREAVSRLHRHRRLTTLGTLVTIAAIVLLALNPSGPGNTPPAPDARASAGVAAPRGENYLRLAAADTAIDAVLGYTPYATRAAARATRSR